MHANGNDFVIIDALFADFSLHSNTIQKLGHRRTGIGFDQMMVLFPPEQSNEDFSYRIFNQDGSPAEQCGNGVRSLAKYIWSKKYQLQNQLTLRNKNQVVVASRRANCDLITVAMGQVNTNVSDLPIQLKQHHNQFEVVKDWSQQFQIPLPRYCFGASIGNPHLVFVMDSPIQDLKLTQFAIHLQNSKQLFPDGINISFVQKMTNHHYFARVFERGVGETMSCGSATCAIGAVLTKRNVALVNRPISITMFDVKQAASIVKCNKNQQVELSGNCEIVYTGLVG